jgi:hypothetical protein
MLLWLLCVGVVAFLVVRQQTVATFAASARTAQGTVMAREPSNHAIVRAAYVVDGAEYEVADSFIGPPNHDFDTVRVGDAVTVYYDPTDPRRAVLSRPEARLADAIRFATVAALILGTLFVGGLVLTIASWRGARRRRA